VRDHVPNRIADQLFFFFCIHNLLAPPRPAR
jgi:hypothetical protein